MIKCKIDGCEKKHVSQGLCGMHYARLKRTGSIGSSLPLRKCKEVAICKIDGCGKQSVAHLLCPMHYERMRQHGEVGSAFSTKRLNGEGSVGTNGYNYVYKPEHPNAYKSGKVAMHVIVMSEIIGRPLRKGESVHHKNGIKSDNTPNNLELRTGIHPVGQSVKDMVEFCKMYLSLYEHEVGF